MNKKVKCDNCKKTFTMSLITNLIKDDIYEYCIKCYHCKTVYPCFYEDSKIRQYKREISFFRRKKDSKEKIKELQAKIKKRNAEIELIVGDLN